MKKNFLDYLKQSLLFQAMKMDQQQSLLHLAETAPDEKLQKAMATLEKAEKDSQSAQQEPKINLEAAEQELASLTTQLKSLKSQSLKIDETESSEEDQIAAEAMLTQI